jgi:phosphoenolpyruvate carboxylase
MTLLTIPYLSSYSSIISILVDMIDIANEANIDVTFFHGKGGTVGRGGNPALYKAIMAHPPNTINGRFRVTEQGEMITQNFGQKQVAERTLDIFTSAVLVEKFTKRDAPKQEWKELMDRMSKVSCDAYRQIVRGEPRFVPYFRSATPEQELAGLNVGSRPAKRNPKGGVESLRAIPWVFAWTQTRFNLPAWLGVGTAFHQELSYEDRALHLKKMYAEWPWFSTLVDLLEMILVKSDLAISQNYDAQLVRDSDSIKLGKELRERMVLAEKSVLEVVNGGHEVLQGGIVDGGDDEKLQYILGSRNDNSILMRSLSVRNPYVDPLNIIQAELLKRLRSDTQYTTEEEKEEIRDALLITINGVAAGMRNSG